MSGICQNFPGINRSNTVYNNQVIGTMAHPQEGGITKWCRKNNGRDLKEDSGKKKSMFVILSRTTTHLTREILHSLQTRPKQQTSSGASFRNSRKKNVQKAAFWIWKQKWYLLLPLTVQVISAKNWKIKNRLWVFRLTNLWNVHLCRSVESKWLRKHAKLTDMNQTRNSIKSLQIIIKHITRQYLMPTHRKWKKHVTQKSLPVFRILTDVDVSSVTTVVLLFTASIFWSLWSRMISQTADTDPCVTMSSVSEKNLQNRSVPSRVWKKWLLSTDSTFPSRQKMQKKHSSGCTSDTLQQSRLRTELPWASDVYLPSLISTSREIWKQESLPKKKLRN